MFGQKRENILVVKTDSLAAFVAAEPVFESIRARHGGATISLLTLPSLQRIARAAPYFDQVAALPDLKDSASRKAFVKQLKTAKFSRVYDLSADDHARRIQGAVGPFGPKWMAAAPPARRGKNRSYADALPSMTKMSAAAGLEDNGRLPDFDWALAARKDSANMQPSWFGISGDFGLLAPGGDEGRRWPAASYGEFARMMAQNGIMPVLVGCKELHGFGDDICEFAPEIVDLTGKTDHLQLAALAREAAFFVSDSAEEVYLAVAVGCSGVLIKKSGEEKLAPERRHVVTLTVKHDMNEASPQFVWQSLNNMGLIPGREAQSYATAR